MLKMNTVTEHISSDKEDFNLAQSIIDLALNSHYKDRSRVTAVQSVVVDIWSAQGLIGNGGLWLGNIKQDDLRNRANSYKILGLDICAEVLVEALRILPPEDSEDDDALNDRLSELEATYYAEDKHVTKVVAAYIRANIEDATKSPS